MSHHRIVSIDVGSTNLGVCVLDCDPAGVVSPDYPARVAYWELVDLRPPATGGSVVANVAYEFMRRPALLEGVTDVLIESQGVARAPIQCIGAAIHAFYATYAMLRCDGVMRVHVVSGVHKLRAFQGEADEPKRAKRGTYAYNKRLSEIHARAMLVEMGPAGARLLPWLAGFSKRDDLCDALLQGMWGAQNVPLLQRKSPVFHPRSPLPAPPGLNDAILQP